MDLPIMRWPTMGGGEEDAGWPPENETDKKKKAHASSGSSSRRTATAAAAAANGPSPSSVGRGPRRDPQRRAGRQQQRTDPRPPPPRRQSRQGDRRRKDQSQDRRKDRRQQQHSRRGDERDGRTSSSSTPTTTTSTSRSARSGGGDGGGNRGGDRGAPRSAAARSASASASLSASASAYASARSAPPASAASAAAEAAAASAGPTGRDDEWSEHGPPSPPPSSFDESRGRYGGSPSSSRSSRRQQLHDRRGRSTRADDELFADREEDKEDEEEYDIIETFLEGVKSWGSWWGGSGEGDGDEEEEEGRRPAKQSGPGGSPRQSPRQSSQRLRTLLEDSRWGLVTEDVGGSPSRGSGLGGGRPGPRGQRGQPLGVGDRSPTGPSSPRRDAGTVPSLLGLSSSKRGAPSSSPSSPADYAELRRRHRLLGRERDRQRQRHRNERQSELRRLRDLEEGESSFVDEPIGFNDDDGGGRRGVGGAGGGGPPFVASLSPSPAKTRRSKLPAPSIVVASSSAPDGGGTPTKEGGRRRRQRRREEGEDSKPPLDDGKPSPARSTDSGRTAETSLGSDLTAEDDGSSPLPSPSSSRSSRDLLSPYSSSSGRSSKLDLTASASCESFDSRRSGRRPARAVGCVLEEEGGRSGGSSKGKRIMMTDRELRELRLRKFRATHFGLFAHGRTTTVVPILCAGVALILSVVAKRSTSFVTLGEPMLVSPSFDRVDRIGLVYLDLCIASEIITTDLDTGATTVVEREYSTTTQSTTTSSTSAAWGGGGSSSSGLRDWQALVEDMEHDDYVYVGPSYDDDADLFDGPQRTQAGEDDQRQQPKVCRSVKISSSSLNDSLWHVSRTFLSLAIALGFLLAFVLTSAAYWTTINLKPVAIGLLLTYFFQSMTFFFFDSEVCREHGCSVSSGSAAAVAASILWFGSAVGTIWMDMVYRTKMRRKRRRERRRARRQRAKDRERRKRRETEAEKDRLRSVHSGLSTEATSSYQTTTGPSMMSSGSGSSLYPEEDQREAGGGCGGSGSFQDGDAVDLEQQHQLRDNAAASWSPSGNGSSGESTRCLNDQIEVMSDESLAARMQMNELRLFNRAEGA